MWAAEDIDAIFDQDPQRVCILQGPLAVRHSKVKDEPVKDMLDNIVTGLTDKLLDCLYGGDALKVPTIEYLSAAPTTASDELAGVEVTCSNSSIVYSVGASVPSTADWLNTISGVQSWWLKALLIPSEVRHIVQGQRCLQLHRG